VRAVSNAGPIIHRSWIDRLDLLAAPFEEVLMPSAVREEVLRVEREVEQASGGAGKEPAHD
jgi:predicted nucleic acid-binding protein